MHKTNNKILAEAVRILSEDIESPDNIPYLCLQEAADRIEELDNTIRRAKAVYFEEGGDKLISERMLNILEGINE